MKDKRCKGYCGVACVDGRCPIALYNEDFTMFERKPTCDDCFHYNGCEDCCFNGTDMCERKTEKGVYDFKFTDDNGTITYIWAKCRTEAIEIYCQEKGCPKEYVKEHCIVRNCKSSR